MQLSIQTFRVTAMLKPLALPLTSHETSPLGLHSFTHKMKNTLHIPQGPCENHGPTNTKGSAQLPAKKRHAIFSPNPVFLVSPLQSSLLRNTSNVCLNRKAMGFPKSSSQINAPGCCAVFIRWFFKTTSCALKSNFLNKFAALSVSSHPTPCSSPGALRMWPSPRSPPTAT